LQKIYGSVKDEITGEWRIKKNIEIETLYVSSDKLEVIRIRRWVGHVWRNQNPLLHAVIEQNPIGKKAFGKKKNALERCNKKGC
jgi:ABC-type phosphate transport system ATPase subunit